MIEILDFIREHTIFAAIVILLNIVIARYVVLKASYVFNQNINEAMGGRNNKSSIYKKCTGAIENSIREYEQKEKKSGLYLKARGKMKKAGYNGDNAAMIYIFLKFVVPGILFAIAFPAYFPDFGRAIVIAVAFPSIVEMVVLTRKRELARRFDRYIYKVYKYLHNQISSGIKVSDAIKTVHYVIEDPYIRNLLIKLAASYELTNDIRASLDQFRQNFDNLEAETLCVALQQGVETGDNQELLARQEQVMFNKYFNYIQAETDSCKAKSVLSVALFTAIIVVMLLVPLFNDVTESIEKIFIN